MIENPTEAIEEAELMAPRFASRAADHDRAGAFPAADFDDLRHGGLLGLMVPTQLGGPGASFADYAEVAMAMAAGNGATALVFNMHASVTGALAHTPDDLARMMGAPESYFEARDEALRAAGRGALFAVAMSERAAGSRLSQVTTTYEPVGDGYRIKGSKAFVSGAGFADYYLVAARSVVADAPAVSHFLVPAGSGLQVEETWDAMGMRATGSHDLHLDVTVGSEALLGGIEGLALPLASLMPQWLVASYASVYVGVAQSAIDAAARFTNERGRDQLPMVRHRLGEADASVAGARLAVRQAARLIDEQPGKPETNRWVYRAKLLAGRTAMDVAQSLLEAAGTAATRKGSPLERIFRDARCGSLQPATSDVCANWLGVAALGGNPDSDSEVARW